MKQNPLDREDNEFRVALEALQNQITTRFPTREDIKTALDALQMQLDHRFASTAAVSASRADALDRLYAAETKERDKAVEVLTERVSRQFNSIESSLREHVSSQISDIRNLFESAEKLELGRVQTINDKCDTLNVAIKGKIESVTSEMATINSASEKAIAKAEASVEKRFDSYDKAAQALRELVSLAMPRGEVLTLIKACTDKIGDLTDRINRNEGKGAGMGQVWGYIVGAAGLALSLIAISSWFNTMGPKVERNTERAISHELTLDEIRRQLAPPAPSPKP